MLLPVFHRHLFHAILALVAALFITTAHAQTNTPPVDPNAPPNPEMVRDAGDQAIGDLLKDLVSHKDFPKRFAILPMQHDLDGDYFTSQLRNKFADLGAANGFELYTRMDDEWKALLNEIKWGEQFGDTMDPATVQKFGRIQGVQGIITGRLVSVSKNDKGDVHVRITVQAFEVETGRFLWGQEKVGEILADVPPPPPAPPIDWIKMGAYIIGCLATLVIVLGALRAMGTASRPR